MKQQLRGACAATGVPYEVLTGDMTGLNDRVMRVLLGEFRRRVSAWQHQIVAFQLCRRVWGWWFDSRGSERRAADLADYQRESRTLHRSEVDAARLAVHQPGAGHRGLARSGPLGFSTRSAEVSERGEDAEVIDAAQAARQQTRGRAEVAVRLGRSLPTANAKSIQETGSLGTTGE
jgi:hypothetical protein